MLPLVGTLCGRTQFLDPMGECFGGGPADLGLAEHALAVPSQLPMGARSFVRVQSATAVGMAGGAEQRMAVPAHDEMTAGADAESLWPQAATGGAARGLRPSLQVLRPEASRTGSGRHCVADLSPSSAASPLPTLMGMMQLEARPPQPLLNPDSDGGAGPGPAPGEPEAAVLRMMTPQAPPRRSPDACGLVAAVAAANHAVPRSSGGEEAAASRGGHHCPVLVAAVWPETRISSPGGTAAVQLQRQQQAQQAGVAAWVTCRPCRPASAMVSASGSAADAAEAGRGVCSEEHTGFSDRLTAVRSVLPQSMQAHHEVLTTAQALALPPPALPLAPCSVFSGGHVQRLLNQSAELRRPFPAALPACGRVAAQFDMCRRGSLDAGACVRPVPRVSCGRSTAHTGTLSRAGMLLGSGAIGSGPYTSRQGPLSGSLPARRPVSAFGRWACIAST